MKKIVLMLLALVVFGNVLGAVGDWIELDVKDIYLKPDLSSEYLLYFFDVDWVETTNPSHYYCLSSNVSNLSNNASAYRKAILATLLSARANGSKVKIKITSVGTDGRSYFEEVFLVK